MGRIISNVGLATGINITDTVNQLLSIQARPRDLLSNVNKNAEASSAPHLQHSQAQLISLQLTVKRFNLMCYMINVLSLA